MATYTEISELSGTVLNDTESDLLQSTSPGPPNFLSPLYKRPLPTLSPGHAAILEMHANIHPNRKIQARLTRLFHNLMQRDHFFRLSRRRSSLPKCVPDMQQNIEDDLPLSPIINIPNIISTIPTQTSVTTWKKKAKSDGSGRF
ncbi:uncharacterized protein CEXT_169501 [Caerostris extrusa]|uniref:Uncharacterized protein n=1 Tax=Caerostris extrusa TaxID=172846 RepID=A0AAV4XKB7_CAEEX|nr:uncharacterized protein CEXT_169501 [Caerostris extrusa]